MFGWHAIGEMTMTMRRFLALLASAMPLVAGAANLVGSIPVGNSPFALSLNAEGTQAIVVNLFPVRNADGTDGPNVRVLDLVAQREVSAFRAGTRLVSVASFGATVLVVNEDQDAVRILDPVAGVEIGQIAVGSRPSSAITLDARTAVVTNGTSGDLMFLDIPGRRVTSTVNVGKDPRAVAKHPAANYAYVALGGENAIVVVNTQGTGAKAVVGRLDVGRNPVGIAFSPSGTRAVVVNTSSNTMSVLDTSNPVAPRLIANVPVGAQPTVAAFGRLDPNAVYVSNLGGNYVTVANISLGAGQMVQGVIGLQSSSAGLAVSNDGRRLYVAEFTNNANLRIYDLTNLGSLDLKPEFQIPGEPVGTSTLSAKGDCATDFYIAEATLGDGAQEGFWGMEVALSKEPRELKGGFNLGGGFDGGGKNPGFGAFSLSSPQRVTFTVYAQALAGPIALKVDLTKDGQRIAGAEGTPGASTPLTFAADLTPGFHVVAINSTPASGRGTFQLALATPGSFAGGVVVGGYITRNPAGASLSGFGAFCVPQSQSVTVKLFGNTEYGSSAAGNLVLTLRDYQRAVLRVYDTGLPGGGLVAPPTPPPVPAGIAWYVDAAGSASGSGSSASPFRSISTAISRARPGDIIFVRKGTYSPSKTGERLPIGSAGTGIQAMPANVQLVGEGAETTIIDGENVAGNLVVIPAAGARFAGFTVKRAGAVGVYVFRAANVTVERVFATGNARFGIGSEGASGLVVRNNVAVGNIETGMAFVGAVPAAAPAGAPTNCPAVSAGAYGAWIVNNTANDNRADGILAGGGGVYCVADNVLVNNGSSGIEFNNRTEAGPVPPLNGAVVNNTLIGNGAQQFAFAGTGILAAENGATMELVSGNKLTKNRPYGIAAFLNAKAGRIVSNTITDTSTSGIIIRPQSQATEIADNTITGSGLAGIFVDATSTVTNVRNNRATGNNRGMSVLDHSVVTLVDGNTFDDNANVGMEVSGTSQVTTVSNLSASNNGAGAASSGSGFQVRDGSTVGNLQASRLLNNLGQGGVFVSNGSQLTMTGTTVDGSTTQGIFAIGTGSRVTVNGGSIVNSRRDAGNQGGFGVNAQQGATVTCTGVTLSGNVAGNAFVGSGSSATGCN
jgi:YVTN family beta-propeller protein